MAMVEEPKAQLLVVRMSIAAFKPYKSSIEARNVLNELSKQADVVALYLYERPNMGSAYRLVESFQR